MVERDLLDFVIGTIEPSNSHVQVIRKFFFFFLFYFLFISWTNEASNGERLRKL